MIDTDSSRIYFYEKNDSFYFSSEAKSLLKVCPELRSLNFNSLGETFALGCALQNRSIFSGLSLLPCGSYWTFSSTRAIKRRTYFQPASLEAQQPSGPREYFDELKHTWSRVLPRYFRGGEKIRRSL